MEIYILRDGAETGPFSEDVAQTMCQDGSASPADFAWSPGMPKWLPLADVLREVENTPRPVPPPHPVAPGKAGPESESATESEPATGKQKAFLGFLGVAFAPEISRERAALLVNDAVEDPKRVARITQWNEERFRLHPDLFAAEIQARKDDRASHYFEVCQSEGAEYFTKVTKAHCQVLVGYLDVKFPNWDARENEAARSFFFPAIAEKFPQLVNRQWRGKLQYGSVPKRASEPVRKAPPVRSAGGGAGLPFGAIARGLVLGVMILGMLYFVRKIMRADPGKSAAAASQSATAAPPPAGHAPASKLDANPARSSSPLAGKPPKAIAQADPPASVPGEMAPGRPPGEPAGNPPVASMEPPGSMAPAAGAPPNPGDPSPPNAANPAFAPAPPALSADPVAAPKVNLVLTRPFELQLTYGKVKLPVGTPIKLVAREGNLLRVSYLNSVILVPATSTDADAAPALPPANPSPTPGVAPGLPGFPPAPAPATPAPTAAPEPPKPQSLF